VVDKSWHVPAVQTHLVESGYVDQTFQVEVMQPLMLKGSPERYPVLYLTDGNELFDAAKAISHSLQASGEVQRFILVGIGYPGDNPFAGDILRGRDLTPPRRGEISGFPRASPIEGVPGIAPGQRHWNGADDFLQFICHELVPLVDSQYPTLRGDRGYFGHSLGGGFGLHALLSQPQLFHRAVISSPGVTWEGDPHGIEPAEAYLSCGRRLEARLFMSVGGEEEFQPAYARSQFCSSFYRLAAVLRQIPGLELTSRLFPGETHASVWPIAFSHGVQTVFGRAAHAPMDVPPGPPEMGDEPVRAPGQRTK